MTLHDAGIYITIFVVGFWLGMATAEGRRVWWNYLALVVLVLTVLSLGIILAELGAVLLMKGRL